MALMKFCSKCNKLHDHDHSCQVGKFDKYYRGKLTYTYRNTPRWRKTRDDAKERDGYVCQACVAQENPYYNTFRLEVHHIVDVEIDPSLTYELWNTITLCNYHHRQVHSKELDLKPILEKLGRKGNAGDTPPISEVTFL